VANKRRKLVRRPVNVNYALTEFAYFRWESSEMPRGKAEPVCQI
jgi:hypothetical protein